MLFRRISVQVGAQSSSSRRNPTSSSSVRPCACNCAASSGESSLSIRHTTPNAGLLLCLARSATLQCAAQFLYDCFVLLGCQALRQRARASGPPMRPSAQAACPRTNGSGSSRRVSASAGMAAGSPRLPSATQTLRSSPRRLARLMGLWRKRSRNCASSSSSSGISAGLEPTSVRG